MTWTDSKQKQYRSDKISNKCYLLLDPIILHIFVEVHELL